MSCVRGHKAIKELSTHPLASISDLAQATVHELTVVRSRLEVLLTNYDEKLGQLCNRNVMLDQKEAETLAKLNNIESCVVHEVQRHFNGLRQEVTQGKEYLVRELTKINQHLLADKCDVSNQYKQVDATLKADMLTVFHKGRLVLNDAVTGEFKIAENKYIISK